TALIPGRPAPRLITEDMVKEMRAGAVIVDMATEQGGNCESSKPGEDVVAHGVRVLGPLNLAATLPLDASLMYARNVQALLMHLAPKAEIHLDFEDEITKGVFMTHAGDVRHAPTAEALE